MSRQPDASLEVALGQRQRLLEDAQQVFSEHERALQEQARLLAAARSRVQMVLLQIDAAHVLGYSQGGAVAQQLPSEPECECSLIVLGEREPQVNE